VRNRIKAKSAKLERVVVAIGFNNSNQFVVHSGLSKRDTLMLLGEAVKLIANVKEKARDNGKK